MLEIISAEVVLDAAGNANKKTPHPETKEPSENGERDDDTGIEGKLLHRDADGEVVDRHPEHLRRQNRRGFREDERYQPENHRSRVARDIGEEAAHFGKALRKPV